MTVTSLTDNTLLEPANDLTPSRMTKTKAKTRGRSTNDDNSDVNRCLYVSVLSVFNATQTAKGYLVKKNPCSIPLAGPPREAARIVPVSDVALGVKSRWGSCSLPHDAPLDTADQRRVEATKK
ncbi:hypothetical protein BaRGS_00039294 [Batillaria attramentaria]|uniref:Uncharacterized protein n=1 Tax=Batillaria attramentaria TaxID=370345 RepID=A0ABD0J3K1_9CAEN